MAIFFFVVGLEIKREIVEGDLRDPRAAMVPIAAAVGGMVVPAAVYGLVTLGSGAGHGWGIPMATDIAFAVGVLRLVGRRAPPALGVTLLTLAIVDDVGAILVIAVFYSTGLSWTWLLGALGLLVLIRIAGRTLASPWWFVAPAVVLWVEMLRSGVHATIAGVLLGLATPLVARNGRPVLAPLEHALHPWASFVVLPLFALANAGIPVSVSTLRDAATSPAAIGILAGLLIGKFVGINLGARLAVRAGGRLPPGIARPGARRARTAGRHRPDRVALHGRTDVHRRRPRRREAGGPRRLHPRRAARHGRTPDDPTGSGRRHVTSAPIGESEQAP